MLLNHELQELPNGNWISTAFEERAVSCPGLEGFPDSAYEADVVGSEVVEFDPASGTVRKRWSSFDALSVCDT